MYWVDERTDGFNLATTDIFAAGEGPIARNIRFIFKRKIKNKHICRGLENSAWRRDPD